MAEPAFAVSERVTDPVPEGLGDWCLGILAAEGLAGWSVEVWGCRNEAVCYEAGKRIRLGLCRTAWRTRRLFLHEVAHALAAPEGRENPHWPDSLAHGPRWAAIYERLQAEHLRCEVCREHREVPVPVLVDHEYGDFEDVECWECGGPDDGWA